MGYRPGRGRYNLIAGLLSAGYENIGGTGLSAVFNQTGGTNVTTGVNGSYNLSAGLLNVHAMQASLNFTGGTLQFSGPLPFGYSVNIATSRINGAATIDMNGTHVVLDRSRHHVGLDRPETSTRPAWTCSRSAMPAMGRTDGPSIRTRPSASTMSRRLQGDYPLIMLASPASLGTPTLSDFVLPTAPAGVTYSLVNNGSSIDLIVAVPEPGTLALLGAGLFGLLGYAWRRRKAS